MFIQFLSFHLDTFNLVLHMSERDRNPRNIYNKTWRNGGKMENNQVTLDGLNSDTSKFSISRSKTAFPFFYSINYSLSLKHPISRSSLSLKPRPRSHNTHFIVLFLAHLSWKLKWAFLITCRPASVCPSVCLSVCLSVNFSHFHLLLKNH